MNDYVKEVAGNGFSAKDFRTWRGTVLAAVSLALGGPVPAGVTARRRAITAAVKDVAEFSATRPPWHGRRTSTRACSTGSTRAGPCAGRSEVGLDLETASADDALTPGVRETVEAAVLDLLETESPPPRPPERPVCRSAHGQGNPRTRTEGSVMRVPHAQPEVTEAVDVDLFLAVLDDALGALEEADILYVLIGGIGSAVFGRDRGTRDIDLFVRPETAGKVLSVLDDRGFDTDEFAEHWLYKATKHGVLVDVIFRSTRDILLGDEMLERSRLMPFRERMVRVAPPEDLVVMKACAASEDTPGTGTTRRRSWRSPSSTGTTWSPARQHGPRRLLSLLLFASSIDIVVPSEPIETLHERSGVAGRERRRARVRRGARPRGARPRSARQRARAPSRS